jgi:CheY-like chemotaxis protein
VEREKVISKTQEPAAIIGVDDLRLIQAQGHFMLNPMAWPGRLGKSLVWLREAKPVKHWNIAENGWKGLQLYRQEHPHVIVLDLKMPELDGVTILRQIRSVDPAQPVIIWTGDTTPETERQVRALGVSEFIVKGSSMKLLVDTLKGILTAATLGMGGSIVRDTLAS